MAHLAWDTLMASSAPSRGTQTSAEMTGSLDEPACLSEHRPDGGLLPRDARSLRVLYVNEAFRNFGPGPAVHGWSLVHEIPKAQYHGRDFLAG